MTQIEKTDTEDADFDRLVGELMNDVRHHIEDEEGDLLPKMRDACGTEDLAELGKKFDNATASVGTRQAACQ